MTRRLLPFLLCASTCLAGCFTVGGDGFDDPSIGQRPPPPPQLNDPMDVVNVIDGDTIIVRMSHGEEKVRLKGVDTPELKYTCAGNWECDAGESCARREFSYDTCGAAGSSVSRNDVCSHAALDRTKQIVGSAVELSFDSLCNHDPLVACRDTYGRLLAYAQLTDGTDLGTHLLQAGLASVYVFNNENFDRKSAYFALEQAAQAAGLGIWGAGCP